MAALLNSHLEQISLCANSIASLPFPGPKIFSNALLSTHDITALIRDTEQHERALFHLAPPPLPSKTGTTEFPGPQNGTAPTTAAARRQTVYGTRQPKNKAVAAVLGGELYNRTRKEEAAARQKGDMDVEVLLEGAEKLANVYPIPGVTEKIAQLRRRHQQLTANIAHYEGRVAQQGRELQMMNRPSGGYDDEQDDEMADAVDAILGEDEATASIPLTKEDMQQEEEEIKELERKKKALEERVTGMERDLGGLMR